ncbi:uncharacterized protein TNCV_1340951 [Trichonephila clavipes]|uniref:Uncharacterized protein n=1 Tax=Trichonephila clavipes TaxID=2585209 RepID=A0A8X6RZ13_TRICX|nr:uncharacterized protein TNCV_1340951 [Trichonephila clavipes]
MGEFRNVFASRKDLVRKAVNVSISRSPDRKRFTDFGSPPIPMRALLIANGDFVHISLFGKESIKNLVRAAIISMSELGNTRPLTGHSSNGSINTRRKLHPGVPPPTTESNKGGSVPVIWQKPGTALTWSTPRI